MIYSGPTSFRLSAPQAAAYKTTARVLLGKMHNQMELGNISYLKKYYTLLDGTRVTLVSNSGQNLIYIVSPGDDILDEPTPQEFYKGALLVWPSDDYNEYGWGEPFNGGLGAPLDSVDKEAKPYTKIQNTEGVITAIREVESDGGDNVWSNLAGDKSLAWQEIGEAWQEGGDKHLRLWFNGQNLFKSLYLGKYTDDEGNVVVRVSSEFPDAGDFVNLYGACLFYEQVEDQEVDDLILRLSLNKLIVDIKCTLSLSDSGTALALLEGPVKRAVSTSFAAVQVEFNEMGDRLIYGTPSSYLWEVWDFNGTSWAKAETYKRTSDFKSKDDGSVHVTSTHIFPVSIAWLGSQLVETTVTVDLHASYLVDFEMDAGLGPTIEVNPRGMATNCTGGSRDYPQFMTPRLRRTTTERYQKQEITVDSKADGKSIFSYNYTCYEAEESAASTGIGTWYLDTWTARDNWCWFGTDMVAAGWDAFPNVIYKSISYGFARDIEPVPRFEYIGWGTASATLAFSAGFQLGYPSGPPDWSPDPGKVSTNTIAVKKLVFNGRDFHPLNGYMMYCSVCDTKGEVDVDFPVPADAGRMSVTVHDVITDQSVTEDLGTKSFDLSLISYVAFFYGSKLATNGDIGSGDHEAHAKALVDELWSLGASIPGGSMICGRHNKEGIGIYGARSRSQEAMGGDAEEGTDYDPKHMIGSFEFDPYSLLEVSEANNGTIHSDKISVPDKIIYT